MADIFENAFYLIRLTYRTAPRYGMDRAKLNMLLSIAQFYGFMEQKTIFSEKMRINQCGTSFPTLDWFVPSQILARELVEDNEMISESQIANSCNDLPPYYEQYKVTHVQTQINLLTEIFKVFYSWSAKEIGCTINEFVDEIKGEKENYLGVTVSFDKAKAFFSDEVSLNSYRYNPIIKFLVTLKENGFYYINISDNTETENNDTNTLCLQCAHKKVCYIKNNTSLFCSDFLNSKSIPPCSLGDVFFFEDWLGNICEEKVIMLQQKADGTWKLRLSGQKLTDLSSDDIGKRVFKTKEEIENRRKT